MVEENIALIIDIMIMKNNPLSVEDLAEETGLDNGAIVNGLNLLKLIDIVRKKSENKYVLVKELKGIKLARAAQMGVDLMSFNYFEISKEEKELALRLSTEVDKIKTIDVKNRKPMFQKRSYFATPKHDDVADNLLILLEASNESLYKYLEGIAKNDEYLALLLSMHEQSEKSYQSYMEYLN